MKAIEIENILKKYGYKFRFDMIHSEEELNKYESKEPNFDRVKYLTIFNKDNIVVGRLYEKNSRVLKELEFEKIELSKDEIDKIVAFFTFFKIDNNEEIVREISNLAHIKQDNIKVELITNNVYKRDIDQSKDY